MALFDITCPLNASTAVWPGDRTYQAEWTARINREEGSGSAVNIGAVSMGTHTGTHADAPLHFDADGCSVDHLDLLPFIGPATVIEHSEKTPIRPRHVDLGAVAPRILFKTHCSNYGSSEWCQDLCPFTEKAIDAFGACGIKLIGTDAPSVDPVDSKKLSAHHACQRNGIAILEGLDLRLVAAGTYELIALPLMLGGLDASPVRAILRK